MNSFDYFSPETLSQACSLLADTSRDARLLAGGTDMLIELRKPSAHAPGALVDLSRIPELKGISETGDSVVIKPLATHTEILRSDIIRRNAPLLRDAVSVIGSPQIRNRGTIGGNVMNAAACADTVPPLMALGAVLTLRSATSQRAVALSEFYMKPYVTTASTGEILTEIRFKKLTPKTRSCFVKLGRRNALSIARLSVAVVLRLDDKGLVEEARIVPGAAFPTWKRVAEAEAMLLGRIPSKEVCSQVGQKVSEMMIAITGRRWSTEYKEPVIAVLVRRALEACLRPEGVV